VAALVQKLILKPPKGNVLPFFGKKEIPNPTNFYSEVLPNLVLRREQRYFSYVHGDLNAANVIVDTNSNVWLIDFFHSHVGHILKDLIKIENDLLYIMTPVRNESELKLAMLFTDSFLNIKDLATPPSFPTKLLNHRNFGRTARTLKILRKFYPRLIMEDIDPAQLMIGQLRYAVHTLSFDEPNVWQKRWALYTAGLLSSLISERVTTTDKLRIDWIGIESKTKGKLGITILPGRKDRERDLKHDLKTLKENKIEHIFSVITNQELKHYGVPDLLKKFQAEGFTSQQLSVHDGTPLTISMAEKAVAQIGSYISSGENVLIHCLGGLGRSGTLAACYLISKGKTATQAIDIVRKYRSPRAIETSAQEKFLVTFAKKHRI
jgi:protein-tyrosine phosphatase